MSVSALSENLASAGVDCRVFTTRANGVQELPVKPGETVTVGGVPVTYFRRLTKDHSHFSPALYRRLKKEAGNFDVVHIHAWWNLVSLFACYTALCRGIPVLLSPRGTLSAYSFQNKHIGVKKLLHVMFGERMLKQCHIHVTTENERASVCRLFNPKSITVLPNFVSLPPREKYPGRETDDTIRLLFFSRVEEKKGLDLLLAAMPLLKCDYTLTIAGSGEDDYIRRLKNLSEQNGSAPKITWAGFVGQNKFEVMQAHDLFILPSHDENFGNAVIECLSTGTAVLISAGVGLADYVSRIGGGWVCENNAARIAEAVDSIAAQRSALRQIREEIPAKIYQDFDGEVLVKQYIQLYQQIAHGGI